MLLRSIGTRIAADMFRQPKNKQIATHHVDEPAIVGLLHAERIQPRAKDTVSKQTGITSASAFTESMHRIWDTVCPLNSLRHAAVKQLFRARQERAMQ